MEDMKELLKMIVSQQKKLLAKTDRIEILVENIEEKLDTVAKRQDDLDKRFQSTEESVKLFQTKIYESLTALNRNSRLFH